MTRRLALAILLPLLLATFGACADRAPASDATRIVVSVPPLAWLARTIAPGTEIVVLVPRGVSPHAYELTPGQAAALRSADVVLLVGLNLEPAGVRGALAPSGSGQVVIHLEDALGPIDAHDADDVHDGHDHGVDPHLWLDPSFMRFGAAQLAGALGRDAAPALNVISAIEQEYAEALAPYAGARIIGVHDAWSRMAERFGLTTPASIMARFELEATPGAVEEAAAALRDGALGVVVVEPQMDPALPRRLSALTGAALVEMDPLGGEDWPATMRGNLARLCDGLARAQGGATR